MKKSVSMLAGALGALAHHDREMAERLDDARRTAATEEQSTGAAEVVRSMERLQEVVRTGADMASGLITLCTGTRDLEDDWRAHPDNDKPEAWRDLLDSMTTAIGIADRYDVDLGIEPELGNVVNSAAKARRLIDELGSPRVKIILDPANLFETASLAEQREIVAAGIDLLADRIAMGHAKDRTAAGEFTTARRRRSSRDNSWAPAAVRASSAPCASGVRPASVTQTGAPLRAS